MACADPQPDRPDDEVDVCPDCENGVDEDGNSTEKQCHWSPKRCATCGWRPCDMAC